MPKNREKTRANRKQHKENGLAFFNEYGVNDPTPYQAVKEIIISQNNNLAKLSKIQY